MMRRVLNKVVSIPSLVRVQRPTITGRWLSTYGGENITYSGGQAFDGQGGFYGSGGARATARSTEHRPELLAIAADVQTIVAVMDEVETLESLLLREVEDSAGEVTAKSIEIRSAIKKLMTAPEFMECLNRLEVEGEPVWGLSSDEREIITVARAKVNDC